MKMWMGTVTRNYHFEIILAVNRVMQLKKNTYCPKKRVNLLGLESCMGPGKLILNPRILIRKTACADLPFRPHIGHP